MKNRTTLSLKLICLLSILLSPASWALSLNDAKSQQLVGEGRNGYLLPIKKPTSDEVKTLIETVNEKRKQTYAAIAQKNKLTLKKVSAMAYKKAVKKTASGHAFQAPNGSWQTK